ncbi:ATPase [Arthrobacter sp. TPD3018]|uniref:McrB family protein n=1 Tax=Bacteria TaxID=2 RepID=UPI000D517F28|nr:MULTISPECIES: AAA family ATPase [Bacteria]PVE52693.1 ATPase [Sphingomonas sp. TPD3009]PVE52877.1 ATPase [Arthrobacter sp. TPD3018]PVE81265.1 ATPase [Sphingomonas melonis]
MIETSPPELIKLFEGRFRNMLDTDWSSWRDAYVQQVRTVQEADENTWSQPRFQQILWDDPSVSSIGPGQSVTVVGAYDDRRLAAVLFQARGTLEGLPLDQRGAALDDLYQSVLAQVHPRYTPRRPKARLARMLAAMFPGDVTCLMDAPRVWATQRLLGAQRLSGDFMAQHPSIKAKLRDALGRASDLVGEVEQSIFAWFLWEEFANKPDNGAVATQTTDRRANAVPAFSLLPANAQRRSLTCVKDNVPLLMAMVREAEQGINREDLVGVILGEATQLNASSAGNMISQAMGGLGLLRLQGSTYRPTERGQEMLTASEPAHVLRGALIGRVFGMGHLLRMVQREPTKLRPVDISTRLKDLVPTWTSTQPGSYIFAWAKIAGLVQVEEGPGGGRVSLTEDGEDYAAALPDDFEERWTIEQQEDSAVEQPAAIPALQPRSNSPTPSYGSDDIVADGCFMERDAIVAAVELLRRKKNLILQGPPGTGKTWLAKRLGFALLGARDPERLTAVQFQPSLSYEDFVRGWRPDGAGGLQLADGVFLDAVSAALAEPTRPFVIVIEEINRGNPAQILGEMLTLIEDGKRSPAEALRLTYPRNVGERVHVPENLYIIGTMNLADRSLALVDLALRRRFAFISLKPLMNKAWRSWVTALGCPPALIDEIAARLGALNDAIAADRTLGEQFRVGHSFVTPFAAPGPADENWRDWFIETVETEIGPLLYEYWYDRPDEAKDHVRKLQAGL